MELTKQEAHCIARLLQSAINANFHIITSLHDHYSMTGELGSSLEL